MASLSSVARTAVLVLHVDSITAEVVTVMRDARIRALLLKGPSIAVWLYQDDATRPYGDTDLLVSPTSFRQAGDVLQKIGFRPIQYSWHPNSQTWLRGSDSSIVDLHRSLIGVRASPEAVWEELAMNTETLPIRGIEVEILRASARAFHVALHAAQHGVDTQGPLEDLTRALRVAEERVWYEAAELAHRLNALPAFAAGLRLDPEGRRVARRLGLPAENPPAIALRAGAEVPVAIALESLAGERSRGTRARLLARSMFPPPLYMRQWSAMHITRWPAVLRRGGLGIAMAYAWRPFWIFLRLPKAISALRRARRGQTRDER